MASPTMRKTSQPVANLENQIFWVLFYLVTSLVQELCYESRRKETSWMGEVAAGWSPENAGHLALLVVCYLFIPPLPILLLYGVG